MKDDGSGPEQYHFLEMYCPDPECDCRRVILWVARGDDGEVVASIIYGFDPPSEREDPYWREVDDEQTYLDPLNPQSELSEEMMDIFEAVVLTPNYQERLERHYELVKEADTSDWDEYLDDGESLTPGDAELGDPVEPFGDEVEHVYLDDSVVDQARKERQRLKQRMTRSDRKKAGRAAKLARYRLETLVINERWREERFANIVAVRQAPGGTFARMYALVDLNCIGLMMSGLDTGLTRDEARRQVDGAFHPDSPAMECTPGLARRILLHAVAWSEQAGLKPSRDVFAVEAFLGRAKWQDVDAPVPLGEDGKHVYVPNPGDDRLAILDVLEENLGPDGFYYYAPEEP
jgi:hypothetical protein